MEKKEKNLYVFEDICSGCKSCEVWCSIVNKSTEFNPQNAKIHVIKNREPNYNRVIHNCDCSECLKNKNGDPICVEMCVNGALVYTDYDDYVSKLQELKEKRNQMPLFRLIAPWKYPYPWRKWEEEM